MSDPTTVTTPEPTTFAELEANGWTPSKLGDIEWLDFLVGPIEVTVFRSGRVTVGLDEPMGEADACRLAVRLAAVVRAFEAACPE
jgi:hypothetical protein